MKILQLFALKKIGVFFSNFCKDRSYVYYNVELNNIKVYLSTIDEYLLNEMCENETKVVKEETLGVQEGKGGESFCSCSDCNVPSII